MMTTVRSRLLMLLVAMSLIAGLSLKALDVSHRNELAAATAMQREEFAGQIARGVDLFGATQASHTYDYTFWDDMLAFVQSPDPKWATDNIDSGLPNASVAAAWVLTKDFRQVYATAPGLASANTELPVPIAELRKQLEATPFHHFFVRGTDGVLEFRTAPIQPTSDIDRKTPAQGYYLTAKLWSKPYWDRIGKFLASETDVVLVHDIQHSVHERVAGHTEILLPLNGLDGHPVAWLRVHNDSRILMQWARHSQMLTLVFLLMAVSLVTVLYATLTHWVSSPLQQVSKALTDGNDEAIASLDRTRTEFVAIAGLLRKSRAQHAAMVQENQERRQLQEELTFIANHDSLTGLPNRDYFRRQLQAQIAAATQTSQGLAVLFVDLDHFKNINDMHGHALGDQMLCEVARRLRESIGERDLVGRLGGDEFLVYINDVDSAEQAHAIAARILQMLSQPLTIEGNEAFPAASIGISLFPAHGTEAGALISSADQAMYHAKQSGRNSYHLFDTELMNMISRRLITEAQLRRVLEREELHLHYQPRVSRSDAGVVSVEALLRWTHPELGNVPPDVFIPIAEEDGLILPIGLWALRQACRQHVAWQQAGLSGFRIAVNLSTKQLRSRTLADDILAVIHETGIAPSHLELELTESALDTNLAATAAFMHRLAALGVRFAIDDFGVGFSCLAYLKDLPVNTLKIDRSFVKGAEHSPAQSRLIAGIISLAQGLGVTVVAEGVENQPQMDLVCRHGCDELQGYLISRPLPPAEFEDFLRLPRLPTVRQRHVSQA
jgi:diguanylate cyclase (GGDEF)-like protein